MMTIAQGRSVSLREFDVSDVDTYCDWLLPHQEWHSWDGPYFRKDSAEEVERYRRKLRQRLGSGEQFEHDGCLSRAVITPAGQPDRLVGTVSWHWESEETNWRRMGISIFDPALRGQGMGSDALELWTSYLFRRSDIVRLDFSTWSGNHGMLGVGRRLGFVEEARFRKARVVNGLHFDSVVFGVLREEWQSR
ncbi:GNAT family protein [Saxibacter everestensis]|uniref:GNAT family protein n=1 Tax=Saxibacter everestensis TaxID=2909229 RepID=A0ABY8QYV7_9MICO|nr:GNAT family protein [Brevibacteriaceae bacterium ZFBP1038]